MISHTGELPAFTWPGSTDRRPSRVVAGIAAAFVVGVITWTTWSWPRESAATTAPAPPPPASGFVASIGRRASHVGRYHAEVVAFTPFATGARQSWIVSVTRRGHRRVRGAHLTVRTWAPETREVSPIAPSVRYVGGGRYRVDGIYFPRPGWWNVALVIEARTGVDSVAFNVVLPAASPTGAEPRLPAAPTN